MLKIGLDVIDTKNYVKSLVTSHNAAILEKLCDVPISLLLSTIQDGAAPRQVRRGLLEGPLNPSSRRSIHVQHVLPRK